MENSSLGAGRRRRSLSRLWLSGIACCSVTVHVTVPQRQCVSQYVLQFHSACCSASESVCVAVRVTESQCVLQCVGVSMCCSAFLSRQQFSGIAWCSVTVRVAVPQHQCVLQHVLQSCSACCSVSESFAFLSIETAALRYSFLHLECHFFNLKLQSMF